MSARIILLILLLVQAAAACIIGYAAFRHGGITSAPLALAAGAAVVLLVRLLITANNFVISARFASVTPAGYRIGAGGRLRMFFEEFMATMLHTSWFMPRAKAHQRIYPASRGLPVLLLHGYGCNSGYWTHLSRRLDAATISHASIDLEPVIGDIDGYVPLVQREVDALCARTKAPAVIIVAHSMGGLVARAYLRARGAARIAHVITLGTPHHGTSLARLGLGRNAAQMRRSNDAGAEPGSDWLRELAASETAHTRALITSIYTHHDNIISPQTSSYLPGTHNIAFGGVGHVAMGRNQRILDRVMCEISVHTTFEINNQ